MGLQGKAFRTFVIRKDGGGPRFEVVGWSNEGVMLAPVGGGRDFIVSKQDYRKNYIKAD